MAHTEPGDTKKTATLIIDGQQVTVAIGTTVLDAAAQLGIKIPTLCWLKKISTTGACRICIVKIQGIERFMTACNTPVKDGIVVTTTSPELESARKKTLELMLVNHPLDCPVCDAAGECDLQDTCYGLNVNKNSYKANLERLPIRYEWQLLESDPNRCILCEKCVKVCREVVGREAIEIVNRGDNTIIDTKTGKNLNCDFCGNCIEACPTGTLISKPFKFSGRPWTFNVTKSICSFCASGCQIQYHTKEGVVHRVTSPDDTYNKGNLCINGRFGYAAFNAPDRITTPLFDGKRTNWEKAFGTISSSLKKIIATNGADAVAGIGSPRITNEENYLFQKFMRGAVGTNNIDSEARLGFFPSQLRQYEMLGYSGGTYPMEAIEDATAIVVLGSDVKAESAGFAYRIIQAANKNNAKLVIASTRVTSLNKFANSFLQFTPGSEAWLVAGLNKAVLAQNLQNNDFIASSTVGFDEIKSNLDTLTFEQISAISGVTEQALRSAALLLASGKVAIIYGSEIIRSVDKLAAVTGTVNLALLTGAVAETGAGLYPLDEKNNTQGMLDMGISPEYLPGYHNYSAMAAEFGKAWNCNLPTTVGKNLFQIIEAIEQGSIKALYVVGSDPFRFMPDSIRLKNTLQKLELLVVQDLYLTEVGKQATVFLPAATGAEKSGSFTSIDNRIQSFASAVQPAGEAKTDFDIFNTLYELIAPVTSLKQQTTKELDHEITTLTALYRENCTVNGCQLWRSKNRTSFANKPARYITATPTALPASDAAAYPFTLTLGTILHHNGSYTTHSANNMLVAGTPYITINSADAVKIGISNGDKVTVSTSIGSTTLAAKICDSVQPSVLFMPTNFIESSLGVLSNKQNLSIEVSLKKIM